MNLWVIFLTGLTTGGLSCMAVQGGLLATAIADDKDDATSALEPVKTIGLFLLSKLAAYTALGFLLGWLGTLVQLSATTRGVIQLLVAIFLIGTALRMLNVHPFFRHFAIQPPKVLTRWLRQFSKASGSDVATPLFLGALTVIIPCGVTQAMMALALSTSSPVQGALLMAAFIVGTMPVFFGLSYLATRLGQTLHSRFTLAAALLILALGLYSLEGGLNVLGSPISVAALGQSWTEKTAQKVAESTQVVTGDAPAKSTELVINVSSYGYEPRSLNAPADVPIKVTFVAEEVYSCASAIVFPSLGQSLYLRASDRQTIEIPAQPSGSTLRYSCTMGMYTGSISFQ